MANNEYGTTWWGRRWLNALSGIDYENRIPRGKDYADAGKVRSPVSYTHLTLPTT